MIGNDFTRAKHYYQYSIGAVNLTYLESRLVRRALEHLRALARERRVGEQGVVERMLAKFAVKGRSVQVIMEMCSESPAVHKVIVGFVAGQVFERMADTDYFSLMTMRSGRKPF